MRRRRYWQVGGQDHVLIYPFRRHLFALINHFYGIRPACCCLLAPMQQATWHGATPEAPVRPKWVHDSIRDARRYIGPFMQSHQSGPCILSTAVAPAPKVGMGSGRPGKLLHVVSVRRWAHVTVPFAYPPPSATTPKKAPAHETSSCSKALYPGVLGHGVVTRPRTTLILFGVGSCPGPGLIGGHKGGCKTAAPQIAWSLPNGEARRGDYGAFSPGAPTFLLCQDVSHGGRHHVYLRQLPWIVESSGGIMREPKLRIMPWNRSPEVPSSPGIMFAPAPVIM